MIIPPGFAHVQHFFAGFGLPNGAAVTYGIAGFGVSTPEAAAELLHDAYRTTILTLCSNAIELRETRVKYGPNATGPFGSHIETFAGALAVPMVAPNTAVLVEKRTESGGRSGRGRFYVPGAGETAVLDSGSINPASLPLWQTEANDFLALIETSFVGMVLLHNASSDPTTVTNLTIDPVAATQRRRLR